MDKVRIFISDAIESAIYCLVAPFVIVHDFFEKQKHKKPSTDVGEVHVYEEQPYKGSALEKKKQLEQAKELLKDWIVCHGGTREFHSALQDKTEAFLKECE